tara:strand:+ start:126 stop:716 length:591 start_codon:yes stop_codon:yes gene_type:complete
MCRAHLIDDEEYCWPIERYLGESYNENIATRDHVFPSLYQYQPQLTPINADQYQPQLTPINADQYQGQYDPAGTIESYGELSSIDNNNNTVIDLEMTIGQTSVAAVDGLTGLTDLTVDMDDIFGADSDEELPSLIDELFSQEEQTNEINTASLIMNTDMSNHDFINSDSIITTDMTITTMSRNEHTIGVSRYSIDL